MNDLTPSYEPETGQVILEGLATGIAGEARLVPVAGVDLAFDLADGHLARAIVAADGAAAALLTRLFGPEAPRVLREAAARPQEPAQPLRPEPGLCAALSSLARLDAARVTSPVTRSSPWWAAEAAVLAEQAGLPARARAEARQAVRTLGRRHLVLPDQAARVALAVAGIAAAEDPEAASQLRKNIAVTKEPQLPASGLDVAAEVEGLEKDPVRLPGLHWMLDPDLVPSGLLRPGLSPHSDLLIRHDSGEGRVIVEAILAPDAERMALPRHQARLVDPAVRRVLAQASFTGAGSRVQAELRLPFPLGELHETWIEVFEGEHRPVRSVKGHRIRSALRWGDAALRAERAPAGLAPEATREDWATLAAVAWERCGCDWYAAGDTGRAAAGSGARPAPLPGPACLAELLGG